MQILLWLGLPKDFQTTTRYSLTVIGSIRALAIPASLMRSNPNTQNRRGARKKIAPEVLICNF